MHMEMFATYLGYPHWLNPGDNAWQLTAATLVGLMSVPGLVVLYGGVMQKRWSVNSMMLAFVAFALVLVVWVLSGSRWASERPGTVFVERLLRQLRRRAGKRARPQGAPGTGVDPRAGQRAGTGVPLPDVDAGLLPVRLRGDHADPDARLRAGPRELQGLDALRAALDLLRLRDQRLPDLGRRLLRAAGGGRLLGADT